MSRVLLSGHPVVHWAGVYRIGNSDPSASIMGALVFNVTVTEPTVLVTT